MVFPPGFSLKLCREMLSLRTRAITLLNCTFSESDLILLCYIHRTVVSEHTTWAGWDIRNICEYAWCSVQPLKITVVSFFFFCWLSFVYLIFRGVHSGNTEVLLRPVHLWQTVKLTCSGTRLAPSLHSEAGFTLRCCYLGNQSALGRWSVATDSVVWVIRLWWDKWDKW